MRLVDASGVNLVTYDGLGSGVGEASALVAELLELAGVPTSRFRYQFHAPTEADHRSDPTHAHELHRSTIAALNAPDHLLASTIFPRVFAPSRHRIGVWHWEVDTLPLPHRLAGAVTDEIWTTSAYQRDILRAAYHKPVAVLPLPVRTAPCDPNLVAEVRRRVTSNPDTLIYAFQFDWTSGRHRKNPEGVLDAFTRAFPVPSDSAVLLIKTINGSKHPDALAGSGAVPGEGRCRHHRRVLATGPERCVLRRHRLLRVPSPSRGLRPDHRQGNGGREGSDRDGLLRQPRLHAARHQPAGAGHA